MFVVNVVSGKGGTGKTLVSAVLSELLSIQGYNVLVVDLDIFVRGITALLYFGQRESLNLRKSGKHSVADLMQGEEKKIELAFQSYRHFRVCPAVAFIDELLDHNDIMPHDFKSAKSSIDRLLKQVEHDSEYDVVIFDSRAGFDELIAATHSSSDCSLLIEEDDQISAVTASNLLHQLQSIKSDSQVYRAVNKWRGSTISDTKHLGNIPFDADVVANYGSDDFFSGIVKSTFEPSIVDIWNKLCDREGKNFLLRSRRISPVPTEGLEKRTLSLASRERLILIYGFMLLIFGLVLSIGGRDAVMSTLTDPFSAIGFISSLVGVLFLSFALFRK